MHLKHNFIYKKGGIFENANKLIKNFLLVHWCLKMCWKSNSKNLNLSRKFNTTFFQWHFNFLSNLLYICNAKLFPGNDKRLRKVWPGSKSYQYALITKQQGIWSVDAAIDNGINLWHELCPFTYHLSDLNYKKNIPPLAHQADTLKS